MSCSQTRGTTNDEIQQCVGLYVVSLYIAEIIDRLTGHIDEMKMAKAQIKHSIVTRPMNTSIGMQSTVDALNVDWGRNSAGEELMK